MIIFDRARDWGGVPDADVNAVVRKVNRRTAQRSSAGAYLLLVAPAVQELGDIINTLLIDTRFTRHILL